MRGNREKESLKLVYNLLKQQLGDVVIKESQNEMAHYDIITYYNEIPIYIEVKERYCDYDKFVHYSNEGFILEDIKYNFLLGKHNRYVNVFRINGEIVIITWDINSLNNKSEDKTCKSTTDFANNDYKAKSVKLIKPNQGTIYILKDNIYEIITYTNLINK